MQETESHAGMGKESLIKQEEDSYKLLCALDPIQDVNFRLGFQNKVKPDYSTAPVSIMIFSPSAKHGDFGK